MSVGCDVYGIPERERRVGVAVAVLEPVDGPCGGICGEGALEVAPGKAAVGVVGVASAVDAVSRRREAGDGRLGSVVADRGAGSPRSSCSGARVDGSEPVEGGP